MGGIEVLEREAAEERTKIAGQKKEVEQKGAEGRSQKSLDAKTEARVVTDKLAEARLLLKGQYLKSTKPFRNRLCPSIETIETAMIELARIYGNENGEI